MSSSVPSTVPDCLKLPIDIDGLHQDERPRKTERAGVGGGGRIWPGGDSLYSHYRDGRRIFRGFNRRFSIFKGLFK